MLQKHWYNKLFKAFTDNDIYNLADPLHLQAARSIAFQLIRLKKKSGFAAHAEAII